MTRLLLWHPTLNADDPAAAGIRNAVARGVPGADVVVLPRDHRASSRLAGAVRAADAVIVAGETLLAGGPDSPLPRAAVLCAAARALRRPFALVGVGAGPLTGRRDRGLARRVAAGADFLGLRDAESAGTLTSAGLPAPFRVGADPTWVLLDGVPVSGAAAGEEPEHVLVVLDRGTGERTLAALIEGLRPLAAAGVELRAESWGAPARAADALAVRLGAPVATLPPLADARFAVPRHRAARVVVGAAASPLVATAAAGTPFVGLAAAPGVAALCRRVGQAVVLPEHRDDLPAAVMRALDGPAPSRRAVREETEAAHDQFRLLRVLLAGGRTEEADRVAGLALVPEVTAR